MALRMTEEEYEALVGRRGKTPQSTARTAHLSQGEPVGTGTAPVKRKYRNRKVEINGIRFDSRHEAEEWLKLMARVKDGELKYVLRQVPFDLPGGIRYFADFVAVTPDGRIEGVYDAKSEITKKNRVYINKKKQIRALYGIEIREV